MSFEFQLFDFLVDFFDYEFTLMNVVWVELKIFTAELGVALKIMEWWQNYFYVVKLTLNDILNYFWMFKNYFWGVDGKIKQDFSKFLAFLKQIKKIIRTQFWSS